MAADPTGCTGQRPEISCVISDSQTTAEIEAELQTAVDQHPDTLTVTGRADTRIALHSINANTTLVWKASVANSEPGETALTLTGDGSLIITADGDQPTGINSAGDGLNAPLRTVEIDSANGGAASGIQAAGLALTAARQSTTITKAVITGKYGVKASTGNVTIDQSNITATEPSAPGSFGIDLRGNRSKLTLTNSWVTGPGFESGAETGILADQPEQKIEVLTSYVAGAKTGIKSAGPVHVAQKQHSIDPASSIVDVAEGTAIDTTGTVTVEDDSKILGGGTGIKSANVIVNDSLVHSGFDTWPAKTPYKSIVADTVVARNSTVFGLDAGIEASCSVEVADGTSVRSEINTVTLTGACNSPKLDAKGSLLYAGHAAALRADRGVIDDQSGKASITLDDKSLEIAWNSPIKDFAGNSAADYLAGTSTAKTSKAANATAQSAEYFYGTTQDLVTSAAAGTIYWITIPSEIPGMNPVAAIRLPRTYANYVDGGIDSLPFANVWNVDPSYAPENMTYNGSAYQLKTPVMTLNEVPTNFTGSFRYSYAVDAANTTYSATPPTDPGKYLMQVAILDAKGVERMTRSYSFEITGTKPLVNPDDPSDPGNPAKPKVLPKTGAPGEQSTAGVLFASIAAMALAGLIIRRKLNS
jgi:hypothetical protein